MVRQMSLQWLLSAVLLFTLFLWITQHALDSASHRYSRLRSRVANINHASLVLGRNLDHIPVTHPVHKFGSHWQHDLEGEKWTSALDNYLELTVTNTSCIYVATHILFPEHTKQRTRHDRPQDGFPVSGPHHDPKFSPAMLRFEACNGQARDYVLTATKSMKAFCDLDPRQANNVRIRYLKLPGSSSETRLYFKGLWLNRGGYMVQTNGASNPYIEVVSSKEADTRDSYASLLASALNMSHIVVDSCERYLSGEGKDGGKSLRSQYFGSTNSDKRFGSFGHRFHASAPSAHILELGDPDVSRVLPAGIAEDQVSHVLDSLVREYGAFIKSIRSTAHEYTPVWDSATQGIQTCLSYNSGSGTSPILLLVPFTRDRRLRRLSRLIVSRVAQASRADGDLAVFWADMESWLSIDDVSKSNGTLKEQLSDHAHVKLAFELYQYLCPLMVPENGCAYSAPRKYDGGLHLPDEAGMRKLLEERKLALIKQKLKLRTAGFS